MGMREKLIELIASKVCDIYSEYSEEWIPHDCGECYSKNCRIAESADHLIANDVVPVVRCRDCVWYENGKSYDAYCNHPTHGISYSAEDDFCSYGERKDNE